MKQLIRHRPSSFLMTLTILLTILGTPVQTVRATGEINLLDSTTYSQNFNTLANSGTSNITMPSGWEFSETGSNADAIYVAGTGSGTAGNTYSFGAVSDTERALGELTSTNLLATIGANFVNNTGTTVTALAINYAGEQWRLGSTARVDQIDFQYSTDATSLITGTWIDVNSLDFIAPVTSGTIGAINGNDSTNRTVLSHTLTGLNIVNGSEFWIRWIPINATGNDDSLAVDDFSLTPILANRTPSDLAISTGIIAENNTVNTVIGTLSTIDPDAEDAFTYTLESGDGDADNTSFNIYGDSLRASEVFDYETKASYSIRVRSTDQGGLSFEKVFTITVIDINDIYMDTTVGHFNLGDVGTCVVDGTIGNGALLLNTATDTVCLFESRILNGGQVVKWNDLIATIQATGGTTADFEVRTGNTTTPDIYWSSWGAIDSITTFSYGQYVQYRVNLSSPILGQTPIVEDVTLFYVIPEVSVPVTPNRPLTSWSNTFSWIGHSDATQYFIQVQKADGTTLLTKWYTASQAGCDTDTGCTITPPELATLGTGNYKWRIRDYGSSGYSPYSPYLNFDLSVTCYTLNTNTSGSGTIQAPAYTCGSGYTAGSTIQLSALPNAGFAFGGWSGDASGTSTPVNITMDANKSVTASFLGETLIAPSGPLTSWNNTFSWTGHTAATNYFVEVRKADNTVVLTKWYTAAQASCDTDTSCTITPSELANLGVGSYKWRVRDYGTYGYGPYSPYMTFDLTLTCYTLTTNVIGSGSVLVPAQTCSGGYVTGSVIQVTGVPSAGFALGSWSGDASGTSNPVSITMNANKSITATFRGETLIAPSGLLTSWSNAFSWTGHTAATNYFVEVRKADNTVVLAKWYTTAQASCDTDTSCFISPTQLASLANGSYKWSVRDYGSTYGYGSYSPYKSFSLSIP
ncbi:MAG: cadherin repeat domain-containing protein [Anaerolineales bacterium]|nr:cadherin repeat domain-containing protein [Anaerolineales bacterium]